VMASPPRGRWDFAFFFLLCRFSCLPEKGKGRGGYLGLGGVLCAFFFVELVSSHVFTSSVLLQFTPIFLFFFFFFFQKHDITAMLGLA
jgi:hypothetical protein